MGYTTDTIRKRLFEVVNFVAATHPKGKKRCRRGDACQITSFNIKNSGLRPEFLYIVGSVELGPVPQWEREGGIADDGESESLPGESL